MKSRFFDITMKVLVFITIALWILAMVRPDLLKDFIEFIRQIILQLGNWNYLIVFLSSLIEAFPVLWVVIPGQNIMLIVWGFFAEQSMNNLIYVTIIACLWAILWNFIGYLLGKHYGDTFFKEYGMWFWLWTTEVKYLKKWVEKWWPLWVILWKFHNVSRAFLPFIAGTMNMDKTSFHINNVIGSVVRSVTMIVAGVIFAQYYETIIDYITWIIFWWLWAFLVYIFMFKREAFMKYIEEKNKEIDEKIQQDALKKANWKK